jgi:hypothetical protein
MGIGIVVGRNPSLIREEHHRFQPRQEDEHERQEG